MGERRPRRLKRLADRVGPGRVGDHVGDGRRRLERLPDRVGASHVGDDVEVAGSRLARGRSGRDGWRRRRRGRLGVLGRLTRRRLYVGLPNTHTHTYTTSIHRQIHSVTATQFRSISMPAGFRRHLCSYRVRGVGGSCAEHLTVESYTIIIALQSYLLSYLLLVFHHPLTLSL